MLLTTAKFCSPWSMYDVFESTVTINFYFHYVVNCRIFMNYTWSLIPLYKLLAPAITLGQQPLKNIQGKKENSVYQQCVQNDFSSPGSINPFPHNDTFWRPWETSLLKTLWGKGEIARNEQFLLFPQCFLPVWINFCHFRQIWNCRLQALSLWKSLNFVVCERVKIKNVVVW